jgi:hypothetical protein
MSDYSNTPPENESTTVRKNILKHFGSKEQSGICYGRNTETWFGLCPDCLMWVRDGHASMEAAVGVWMGRWAGSSDAPIQEVNAALDEYTHALRDEFGVDAVDDLDAPCDEAPDHKSRCRPLLFTISTRHRKPVLKVVGGQDHSDQE